MIYTGQLTYKEINFTFAFDGTELRLIPPQEKRDKIENEWMRTSIEKGMYILNIPILEERYLFGMCNETGQKIIFLTKKGSYIGGRSSSLTVEVIAYIMYKYDRPSIDRISFFNPEINAIHPVNQSFSVSHDADLKAFNQNGIISVTTKDFASTATESQSFGVDNRDVTAYFTVSRRTSFEAGEAPLSLNSSLIFEFEATDDYEFILRLWRIAKDFLTYLCYRRDVYLPTVKLSAPCNGGKHEEFATLHIVGESKSPSVEDIKAERYIKQAIIAGHEGEILADIASGELYLRHIPESYISGRSKDAAKFVMITAAFEWEFRRNYPAGVEKHEATKKAEDEVESTLQELLSRKECCGRVKKIYKFLNGLVRSNSLQSKIVQVGKDYSEIINLFGDYLYSLNNEKLIYCEMGERINIQRNNFAHGNLNKDFIGLSLLDLIFLEYIVYALQLKHYNIDDSKIQTAIKNLFHCKILLPGD